MPCGLRVPWKGLRSREHGSEQHGQSRSCPPPTELKEICELTAIDQSVLERAFSFRTVEAKQEKVSTTLNVAQVGEHSARRGCFGGLIALYQGGLNFIIRLLVTAYQFSVA